MRVRLLPLFERRLEERNGHFALEKALDDPRRQNLFTRVFDFGKMGGQLHELSAEDFEPRELQQQPGAVGGARARNEGVDAAAKRRSDRDQDTLGAGHVPHDASHNRTVEMRFGRRDVCLKAREYRGAGGNRDGLGFHWQGFGQSPSRGLLFARPYHAGQDSRGDHA